MTNILAVGDSITFGLIQTPNTIEQGGGYRTVLDDSLKSNGFTDVDFVGSEQHGPTSIDRDHEGHPGWEIRDIANGRDGEGNIDDWITTENPDILLLMIGTNDTDIRDTDDLVSQYNDLIEQIDSHDVEHVLLASIPPFVRSDTRNERGIILNAAIEETVEQKQSEGKNYVFVDVFNALTVDDIAADEIHPTSLGYSIIGNAWHNALLPILDPSFDASQGDARGEPFRIEAEDFDNLGDFEVEDTTLVGNPQIIRPSDDVADATATTNFTGSTGRYDIVLGYFDETDGEAEIEVSIDGELIESISLNQDFGGEEFSYQNYVRQTLSVNHFIEADSEITITGTSDQGERAVVEYIEFIPILIETPANNGPESELIIADALDNQIFGFGADDFIFGFSGNDTINGGEDNDVLRGGNGNDILNGGAGDDILIGGIGDDTLTGGAGEDLFVLRESQLTDTITDFEDGSDKIVLLGGLEFGDLVITSDGVDTTIAAEGTVIATLTGVSSGIDANDFIDRNANGSAGDNDFLFGNSNTNNLIAGDGNDHLFGFSGNDILNGGAGIDHLLGQQGDDSLIGGAGSDFLRGGNGNDTLNGGADEDIFVLEVGRGTDTIVDFNNDEDLIRLTGDLEFAELSITASGSDAQISFNGELLAILENTDISVLDGGDFFNAA